MWITDKLGLASWQIDGHRWCLDARGGSHGIGLVDSVASDFSEVTDRIVSFNPVEQDELPVAAEQFVRGRELHVTYPQGAGVFELRIVFHPIESSDDHLVLEMTVAIQTDQLDTHPMLDLDADCESVSRDDAVGRASTGSAAITVARAPGHSVGLLLGPHDGPYTSDHSTASRMKLRLFGEFLEKGVIRKARPWIVIRRGPAPPEVTQLRGWLEQLCDRPLPLTA